MKLEKDMDSLKFPMIIPGLEQFGSTIFVRDAYKHIYNIIIWGDISASSDPGHRSYVVLGTPGKLTVNPFTSGTHSLLSSRLTSCLGRRLLARQTYPLNFFPLMF